MDTGLCKGAALLQLALIDPFAGRLSGKGRQQQEPQALLCHAEQSHSPDYPGGLIVMLYTSTASFIQEWGRQDSRGDCQTAFALLIPILQKKVSRLWSFQILFASVLHTHSVTELNFWETEIVHISYIASPRLLENMINFDFNLMENVAINWNQPSLYKKYAGMI